MSLSVLDLKPGDRVILNCPKAKNEAKREAQFEGIFHSLEEATEYRRFGAEVWHMHPGTAEFLASGRPWARFLMQTVTGPSSVLEYPGGGAIANLPDGVTAVIAAFAVEPDGGMREEEGRRVFVERRVVMGQG